MIVASRENEPAEPSGDGQFLTLAGFFLALGWINSLVSNVLAHAWEPQGLIVKQWLAVGVLAIPYVALYAFPKSAFGRQVRGWLGRVWSLSPLRAGRQALNHPLSRSIASFSALALWFVFCIVVSIWGAPILRSIVLCFNLFAFGVPWLLGRRARAFLLRMFGRSLPYLRSHVWSVVLSCIRTIFVGITMATSAWLIFADHRHIALLLGALQTLVFFRLVPRQCSSIWRITTILATSVIAWTLAIGFTSVPLDEWLLSAVPTTGLAALAFALAFVLVLNEFADTGRVGDRRRRLRASWVLAAAAFVELGLRTDGLLADWIPYHRTYWVAPADFIRKGAWPLWDYPSQYGVLSELSVAFWPAKSTWQALYIQTAIVLFIVAAILFGLFVFRRSGFANKAFALCFAAAVVYSSQGGRYPMGWRIYPQLGLRFQWLVLILGIALLLHRYRENRTLSYLGLCAGHLIWAISIAWSFECGVFTGLAWMTFVVVDAAYGAFISKKSEPFRVGVALLPIVLVPAALYLGTETVYRAHFGHGPDWLSYFEFSAAYQRDGSGLLQTPNVHGALWMIVLMLVGVASVGVAAIRQERYNCLPLIVTCWVGLWVTSSYFFGEPVEVHANGLGPVFATVIGVLMALQRIEGGTLFFTMPTRAALAPFFILLIAYAFGEPGHVAAIRAPFTPGFSIDSTSRFPVISGELADLMVKARVGRKDEVILPTQYLANKLDIGLTLPFIKDRNGNVVQQTAWLPMSPIGAFNTLYTLPYERRLTYLTRYYDDVRQTGWLVTYHRVADCNALIAGLRTSNRLRSPNFEIVRCVPGASLHVGSISAPDHNRKTL